MYLASELCQAEAEIIYKSLKNGLEMTLTSALNLKIPATMQMVGENSRDAPDQTCTKGLAGRAGRGLNFMEASSNVNRRSWSVEYVLLGFKQMANSKDSMRPYIAG